ncbi:MAG TPA: hypothetical protein VNB94_13730 [Mycobacteriales bacterium]|nr:hypothetical protein [Mycobacteriales bacterium]
MSRTIRTLVVSAAALTFCAPTAAHAAARPVVLAPPFAAVQTYQRADEGGVLACGGEESGSVNLDIVGVAECAVEFALLHFRVAHPGSRVDVVMDIISADSQLPECPAPLQGGSGAFVYASYGNLKGDDGSWACEVIHGAGGVPFAPSVTMSFTALTRGEYVLSLGVGVVSRAGGMQLNTPTAHTSVRGTISSVTLTPPAS